MGLDNKKLVIEFVDSLKHALLLKSREMLFKLYVKGEFFQNSCIKRNQNYPLNTIVLDPSCFSM